MSHDALCCCVSCAVALRASLVAMTEYRDKAIEEVGHANERANHRADEVTALGLSLAAARGEATEYRQAAESEASIRRDALAKLAAATERAEKTERERDEERIEVGECEVEIGMLRRRVEIATGKATLAESALADSREEGRGRLKALTEIEALLYHHAGLHTNVDDAWTLARAALASKETK